MKAVFIFFVILSLAACTVRTGTPRMRNVTGEAVKIVREKPQNCRLVADIMGNQNSGKQGRFLGGATLENEMLENLRNNTARMGGNVVYVPGGSVKAGSVSADSNREFYVNDVRYGALVYDCPR